MKESGIERTPRIITIAGCKGGVGKSVIACALAIEAGRAGKDAVLVDADLGGANVHTYLGLRRPERVMSDFISRKVKNIEEIILPTEIDGVRLISCAGNAPSQANLKFAQKAKIINSLSQIEADLLIVDIGAGSSNDVIDFFSMTDGGVLVTTPEPASIINSYGFMKNVIYRRFLRAFKDRKHVLELVGRGMNPAAEQGIAEVGELMDELSTLDTEGWLTAKSILSYFVPRIIVNRATSELDARVDVKLQTIIGKYLSIKAECLGEVVEDPALKACARKMTPFMVSAPDCPAAQCMRTIARRLFEPAPLAVPMQAQTA